MNDDTSSVRCAIARGTLSRRAVLRAAAAGCAWAGMAKLELQSAYAATGNTGLLSGAVPTGAAPEQPISVAGSGDALFAALSQAQWGSAHDSQTIRQALRRDAPGYREFGDTGVTAVTTAWSGAAFDPINGIEYVTGGGHHDSNCNAMFAANFETGAVKVCVQPSILTPAVVDEMKKSWPADNPWNSWDKGISPSYLYPDGRVGAVHTYGSIWYLRGKVVQLGHFWTEYDVIGGVQSFTGPVLGHGSPNNLGVIVGDRLLSLGSKAYDYWGFRQYDTATRTETTSEMGVPYSPGSSARYSFSGSVFACAIGNDVYCVNPSLSVAWSFDVSRVQKTYVAKILTLQNPWSPPDATDLQMNTSAYDAHANLLYIPSKDFGYFLTWNPLTGACGKFSVKPPGLPKRQSNSAYGRLRYYAKRRCLLLVNSVDEPLYYLKLA